MNYTEAKKYLKRAKKSGYVAYHSGICMTEGKKQWGGNTSGNTYGVNIDGDGRDGRYFGCPKIIWSVEEAENMFPSKTNNKNKGAQ